MYTWNFRAQSAAGQVTGPTVAVSRVIESGARALGESLPALFLAQLPIGLSTALLEHLHYYVAREVFTHAELRRVGEHIRSGTLNAENPAALFELAGNLITVFKWEEREQVIMLPIELDEDTLVKHLLPKFMGRHWLPLAGLHGFLAYLVRHPQPRLAGTRVVTLIGTAEEPELLVCAFDRAGAHKIRILSAAETADYVLRTGDVILVRERTWEPSN